MIPIWKKMNCARILLTEKRNKDVITFHDGTFLFRIHSTFDLNMCPVIMMMCIE